MESENFSRPKERTRADKKRPRSSREKELGAREIIRRTEWLSYPLVYWRGFGPASEQPGKKHYRHIMQLVEERFEGSSPGLYALELRNKITDPNEQYLDPVIESVIPVSKRRLARSNYAFEAASRYPKALPKVVQDPDGYKAWVWERLHLTGEALRAAERLQSDAGDIAALMQIIEVAFGVGECPCADEAGRKKLQDLLSLSVRFPESKESGEGRDADGGEGRSAADSTEVSAGARAAAVTAGQQGLIDLVPSALRGWARTGKQLRAWPAELIVKLSEPAAARLAEAARSYRHVDSEIAAHIFREYMFLAASEGGREYITGHGGSRMRGSTGEILVPYIEELMRSIRGMQEEPEHRAMVFHHIVRDSVDYAFMEAEERRAFEGRSDGALLREDAESIFRSVNRECFLRSFPKKTSEWYYEKCEEDGLGLAAEWHIGKRAGFDFREYLVNASAGQNFEELRIGLTEKLEKQLRYAPVEKLRHPASMLAGLSGRICAAMGPESARQLAAWFRIAYAVFPVGKKGTQIHSYAMRVLLRGIRHAGGNERGIRHLLLVLGEKGHSLFYKNIANDHNLKWKFRNSFIEAVAKTGALSDERFRRLLCDIEKNGLSFLYNTFLGDGETIDGKSLVRVVDWFSRQKDLDDLYSGTARMLAGMMLEGPMSIPPAVFRWIEKIPGKTGSQWSLIVDTLFRISEDFLKSREHLQERRTFLEENLWLLDLIYDFLSSYMELADDRPLMDLDLEFVSDLGYELISLIEAMYHAQRRGFENVPEMGRRFIQTIRREVHKAGVEDGSGDFPITLPDPNNPSISLYVDISNGDPEVFVNLVSKLPPSSSMYRYLPYGIDWGFLRELELIMDLLIECARVPEFYDMLSTIVRRAWALHRLQLTGRFVQERLPAWENPDIATYPDPVPPRMREKIDLLHSYALMTERRGKLPKIIRKIIAMPQSVRGEARALKKRRDEGDGLLDESAAKRLVRLEEYERDPRLLEEEMKKKFEGAYGKQLLLLRIESLIASMEDSLGEYWYPVSGTAEGIFDDPDWLQAFYLYFSVKTNKKVLRKMLAARAAGERDWPLHHPANLEYLERLSRKGIETGALLEAPEKTVKLQGNEFRVYEETDPLKVLQMGNPFETCLSVGDFNDFAVVANAVEVNKEVLYMKDSHGRLLARRLLAVSPEGALASFTTYVSEEKLRSPAKLHFDLLCLDIVRRTGLHFPDEEEKRKFEKEEEKAFAVFCRWYYDELEDVDWWVRRLAEPGCTREMIAAELVSRQELDADGDAEVLLDGEDAEIEEVYTDEEAPDGRAADERARLWLRGEKG